MFKPMFEKEGWKPSDKKRLPRPINPPVNESRLLHRKGEAVLDADGRVIDRKGEWVKTPRKTLCGLRDKMALHSSAAKRGRFVNAQQHADRAMDTPAPPCLTPPAPRRVAKPDSRSYRMVNRILG